VIQAIDREARATVIRGRRFLRREAEERVRILGGRCASFREVRDCFQDFLDDYLSYTFGENCAERI